MNWPGLISGAGGPVLAGIFGIAGVILGRYIAQGVKRDGEEKLNSKVNIALTVLFSMAIVGYVMDNPTTSPLRLLGYGGAAGFLGLALLEFLSDQFMTRLKAAWEGFMNPKKKEDPDGESE